MTTLFTKIIDGHLPGRFIWADPIAVAFTSIAPLSPGHTLVVSRAEINEFTEAPDDLLAHLTRVSKIIGQAQKDTWNAPRAALIVAGFEVPHLHLHVLPAWGEAELSFAHAKHDVVPEIMDADAERLRSQLTANGYTDFVPTEMSKV